MHPTNGRSQPQMQTVAVMDRKQWIVCPCGGRGVIFNAAFLVKGMLVGAKPEIAPVMVLLCNACGKEIEPPFRTLGELERQPQLQAQEKVQ